MRRIAFIILLTSLFACNYGSQGIFYALEHEEKTPDGGDSMNNSINVTAMAELGGVEYVAGTLLYYRSLGAATWSKVDLVSKSGFNRMVSLAVADTGDRLLLITRDGNTANAQLQVATDPVNGAWSAVSLPAGENPVALLKVQSPVAGNSALLLVTEATSINNPALMRKLVHRVTGPTVDSLNLAPTELAEIPTAAAFDGNNYYLVSGNQIFTGTLLTAALTRIPPANVGTQTFGGIAVVKDLVKTGVTAILVSSTGGRMIFATTPAPATFTPLTATWTGSATDGLKKTSADTVAVNFGPISVFNDGTKAYAVVGSRPASTTISGAGYFEITGSEPSAGVYSLAVAYPSLTIDTNNYTPSLLASAETNLFFTNSLHQLYIGTAGYGLWSLGNTDHKWTNQ